MKQDPELLRIVGNDILLRFKLFQCRSKPYIKVGRPSAYREGKKKKESAHTMDGGTTGLVRMRLLCEIRVERFPVLR